MSQIGSPKICLVLHTHVTAYLIVSYNINSGHIKCDRLVFSQRSFRHGMLIDELKLLVGGDGPQVCGHHGFGFITYLTDTAKRKD